MENKEVKKNYFGVWLLGIGIVGMLLGGNNSVIGIALGEIAGLCVFAAIIILIVQGIQKLRKNKKPVETKTN